MILSLGLVLLKEGGMYIYHRLESLRTFEIDLLLFEVIVNEGYFSITKSLS